MPDRRRRPTSADVAARAGVSRTTVSFVLNQRSATQIPPATQRRVLEAAEALGYHPHGAARQLAAGASLTLGFVLRQSAEQVAADALLAETLWGLATAARAGGYRVLVEPLTPGEGRYADLLRSQRVDGIVVSGPRSDDDELALLIDDGFPIVLQGSRPDLDVPSVDVDNRAGARVAVEHLIGQGHTRVGCITNAPLAYTSAVDRLAGYRDAMEAAGLHQHERWVIEGAFDAGSGRAAMTSLLAEAHLTAVFVASDVVAFGALRALRDAGRKVPDDMAVAGFDGIALSEHFDPPLTTIRIPAERLGRVVGEALVERVAGRPVQMRTLLPTQLVIRESTGLAGLTLSGGP